MQPPQIPSTPVVAQQALEELVDYYCQLADYHRSSIDYHQQLVEKHSSEVQLVEKQLASIKALLDPLTEGETTNQQANEPTKEEPTESASANSQPKSVEPEVTASTSQTDEVASNGKTHPDSEATIDELPTKIADDSPSAVEGETASSNNGSESKQDSKKQAKSKSSGSKATNNGKKTRSKAKKTKSYSSRLPDSPLLEPYETIADAVAGCLQEFYPKVMSADDILKHYYPKGLSGETKKRAYGAISNTLSKGAGNKGWIRESIGKYRWREGI
ncbi:hypothetical protein [Myxosarcina sp. GI1]|uniref:hypothetical protein n=1 Tax=Myxosarcina sp. GI1 TaxID=1541065 RepID=UPI0009DD8CFA|nr:hypothetical protein [Myxosarcina sp. GI1]